jgi:hypothetical protein
MVFKFSVLIIRPLYDKDNTLRKVRVGLEATPALVMKTWLNGRKQQDFDSGIFNSKVKKKKKKKP